MSITTEQRKWAKKLLDKNIIRKSDGFINYMAVGFDVERIAKGNKK